MKSSIPKDLGGAVATRLNAAGKVGERRLAEAVEKFLKRAGPELLKLAKRGENPFDGGGVPLSEEWLAKSGAGVTVMTATWTGERSYTVPQPPGSARADHAPELKGVPGIKEATLGSIADANDARIRALFSSLDKAFAKHGLTFVGMGPAGINDHTPVVVYSSKHTAKVARGG